MESSHQIAGTSELWAIYERKHGICGLCSGMGELALTDRAARQPKAYPDELEKCPDCDGTQHPKAVTPTDESRRVLPDG